MADDELKNSSLSDILQNSIEHSDYASKFDLDEDKIKQALLERPRFSIKARLTLMFLVLFLISAAVSITAMIMLSRINYRVQYVTVTDGIANEIQHARRCEKNYFLYNSDLSEIWAHIANADNLLEQASLELRYLVGRQELDSIRNDLRMYSGIIGELIDKADDPSFKQTSEYADMARDLRTYGSRIMDVSLDISRKERQRISSTILTAKRIQIILLIAVLVLSIIIITGISRHILKRLNRLMEAAQRFASGDFAPITPKRKYKDEFSQLAITFNHMMYELEKRQRLLVESHKLRAIGNLTAGIAHELNNPLNNIIITSEMLKDGYKEYSDEECEDMINDLVSQGERAQQVVKNLLDFARESETKSEYLHIDNLISETVQLAKNQIKLKKIKLTETVAPNLPPIYGDRKLLIQVFLNLILNAIDAMPNGGALNVNVKDERNIGFVAVQVIDNGSGIPEYILKSIFNPFFTTKPVGKGTGLGLSVSRGIIEKHGGYIDVESKVGHGSTFTVYLPIVPIPAKV